MDKVYGDPILENDNTEHIRGKRLSSILKAPRNPLDDLGNGNELTQEINIEKRRKNSRRVSFANTIKVFQRDLKNNTTEGESTGMNTLLHAPIQALVQQAEWQDVDNTLQRTNRHDTTLIFSDENEMEMTASHTAVITRDLKNSHTDTTEKIDITSFLAGLNSHNGQAETSKEFHFFSDPTNHSCPSFEQKEDATTVKKIDFNAFLMSLKSNEKGLSPSEGPEKENVFVVPLQVSDDVARPSVEFVYSHEPLDACNLTRVFRGQEDGMEMTKCQAAGVKAVFAGIGSISSETVFRGDKTVVFSKCDDMEITGNYTDLICNNSTKEMKNCQNSDRQEKTWTMKAANKVLPTRAGSERDSSVGKIASEEDFKNPPPADGLHSRGAEEPLVARTSEPRQGGSQLPLFSEKSVVFPSGENMDLTGNCLVTVPDYNIKAALSEGKAVPGYLIFSVAEDMEITKTHTAVFSGDTDAQDRESVPATSAAPADRTIVFTHNQDDMEITASHTIAVNNNVHGFENQE
ncbi:KNL1 protein, partial [Nyctiprogne leucopyga]|nr:KNL1 protein [Nyctiprogne leucopyga]